MAETIILDAGHGGLDNGAMYRGRKEKDDALKLVMSLGEELEKDGYRVEYTRMEDKYYSPFEKARAANRLGGDLFLSVHRDFDEDGEKQGAKAFVFRLAGLAGAAAEEMLAQLEKIGFDNLGVQEKNGLAVLKRTVMPAVLLELGFLNSAKDNQLFDAMFRQIVNALADAIRTVFPLNETEETGLRTEQFDCEQQEEPVRRKPEPPEQKCREERTQPRLETFRKPEPPERKCREEPVRRKPEPPERECREEPVRRKPEPPEWKQREERTQPRPETFRKPNREDKNAPAYWVQTGVYGFHENAAYQKELLEEDGYPVSMLPCDAGYSVRVGGYSSIDEAAGMQKHLRNKGYETLIVSG